MFRGDYRPTDKDSIAVKYQTFYTTLGRHQRRRRLGAVGSRPAALRLRRRHRQDRLHAHPEHVDDPRVLDRLLQQRRGRTAGRRHGACAASSARRIRSSRGSASLPGSTIRSVSFRRRCSATSRARTGRRATTAARRGSRYDGRWPIYGNDIAINAAINLTHTRGRHTYKMGVMREDELFGQARSGTFGGQFNFADDALHPNRTGYAWANAVLGQVARYTESMGRVPDDRRQKTWAWYVQDTWKTYAQDHAGPRSAHVQVGTARSRRAAKRRSSARSDSIRRGAAIRPCSYQPVLVGTTRSRAESAHRPDPAGHVHRLDGAGHRVQLHAGHHGATRRARSTASSRSEMATTSRAATKGFIEPLPIQFDPRVGMAWALNPRTVIRVAGGSFHDGTGGAFGQQGDANVAYRLTRTIFYTDYDSYLNAGGAALSGAEHERTGADGQPAAQQPALHVGDSARNRQERRRRCRVCRHREASTSAAGPTSTRSRTCAGSIRRTATRRSPQLPRTRERLPDAFLRPILGYSDINIASNRSDGRPTTRFSFR